MAQRTDSTAVTATNNPKPDGDESDARMARIEEILGYTATPLLDKCELVAEWVKHAAAKLSVFGQIVPKPKGGRPEGGVARAARDLPVPGKTPDARRKFIERAMKIDGIWPDVKAAARAARARRRPDRVACDCQRKVARSPACQNRGARESQASATEQKKDCRQRACR